ncbi:MAG: DUF2891 domain-containing protein [Pirellulaceae bacterium]
MNKSSVVLCLVFAAMVWNPLNQLNGQIVLPSLGQRMSAQQVDAFVKLALKNIDQEYPNKPGITLSDPELVVGPKQLFPAFYGSFDWHSCVHAHWMLVRLLKLYPDLTEASTIREKLSEHLSRANLEQEAKLFATKENKSFERMYGWAWLLRLVAELETWDDPQARTWRQNLRPLENVLVKNAQDYLPKLSYPIRTGEHTDTGFALSQILDYARVIKNPELEALVVKRAIHFYGGDVDYPTRYEPSGHDFFSSCWNEADLMRRVLPRDEFEVWFRKYLPGLNAGDGQLGNLLTPVEVSDVTDGKLVHLAGLDLSRAWCLNGIAGAQPGDSPIAKALRESSVAHGKVGMSYVFSGHYEGDHWLATFAVYWLTEVGIETKNK